MSAALDDRKQAALEQAAHWYARLHSGAAGSEDRHAWQTWRKAEPLNDWAWQQAESLQRRLQGMPARLSGRTLDLAGQAHGKDRRNILKGMVLLLGGGAMGWTGYQQVQRQHWLADFRSTVGQRLPLTLADGSQVQLNTDSAIDVQYDPGQRLLVLRQGQIMVSTAPGEADRPFILRTPHGTIRTLDARFSVHLSEQRTRVAVYEHQATVTPLRGQPHLLDDGQQSLLNTTTCTTGALDRSLDAWTRGLLIANDRRLADLLAEIGRYRVGWLRCDPAIADLRISGTFRLDDTDQALRAIASALPVHIETRTPYWITVRPA